MAANGHATLSASSAHRWIACPPSARLAERFPDTGSTYADEGTEAHKLAEHKLRAALGLPSGDPTATFEYYSEEMEECCDSYVLYVQEVLADVRRTCADPVVFVEQRVAFDRFVPDGFGTADCVIIGDGALHVVDFKFGKGVHVAADGNPQLKLYGLDALEMFGILYDISTVTMHVFQPRIGNVDSATVAVPDLLAWGEDAVKPIAAQAYQGDGEFAAGAHCKFCAAKRECRALAERSLELAKYDFKPPPLLKNDEVAAILERAKRFTDWLGDIAEYALSQALRGEKYPGFKVVAGTSKRTCVDEQGAIAALTSGGYAGFMTVPELAGVGVLDTVVGKKNFDAVLGAFYRKPPGRPTLAPDSDKREPMTISTAEQDFAEPITENP
jgi:hypothetical protein